MMTQTQATSHLAVEPPARAIASAVVALINSSPRTPARQEIEATIARVQTRFHAIEAPDPQWAHLASEYRRLRAEADALWRKSNELLEGDEDDERICEAANQIEARVAEVERQIWAHLKCNLDRNLDHIVLLAEIAMANENGIMESLAEADPYHDTRSAAELIKAVLDLAGGRRPS